MLCNSFDDVIAIYQNGSLVAKYTYDSWGKLISIVNASGISITDQTNIALQNSIRYREYVYDTETGLYYLQSRYYDPETCRFINADDYDLLLCSPKALTDKNLFAYCDNNPIVRKDEDGDCWILIGAGVGALIGGVVSAISQYATSGSINWGVVGVNMVAGAVSGALASTGVGLGVSVAVNAALGGGTYIAEQSIKKEKITVCGVIASTAAGAIGGLIGGKGANSSGLSTAWKSASQGINRELRRTNAKYAAKQIAKYTLQKTAVKTSAKNSVSRFVFGAMGNAFARWKFGF